MSDASYQIFRSEILAFFSERSNHYDFSDYFASYHIRVTASESGLSVLGLWAKDGTPANKKTAFVNEGVGDGETGPLREIVEILKDEAATLKEEKLC
jgi:hypothetical protein